MRGSARNSVEFWRVFQDFEQGNAGWFVSKSRRLPTSVGLRARSRSFFCQGRTSLIPAQAGIQATAYRQRSPVQRVMQISPLDAFRQLDPRLRGNDISGGAASPLCLLESC